MGCLEKLALAGAFAALLAQPARAADLFGMPAPDPSFETTLDQPTELGSGWYLKVDGGLGQESVPALASSTSGSKAIASINFGAGYKFNQWFRADLTFDVRQGLAGSASTLNLANGTPIICPYQLQGLTSQGANPVLLGYLWSQQAGTCSQTSAATINSIASLVNGYVDLGTWHGVTPYVGAGLGAAKVDATSSVSFFKTSDGSPFAADYTPTGAYPAIWVDQAGNPITNGGGTTTTPVGQPVVPGTTTPVSFGPQKWNQSAKKTSYNLAWALMAGVAYDISDHAKLDLGFRYLNLGSVSSIGGASTALTAKEVRFGLRYMID